MKAGGQHRARRVEEDPVRDCAAEVGSNLSGFADSKADQIHIPFGGLSQDPLSSKAGINHKIGLTPGTDLWTKRPDHLPAQWLRQLDGFRVVFSFRRQYI